MHIEQFVAESLGDASYLVVSGGKAAVVDPQRDIRPFLAAAERYSAEISWVFETHVHNDYVSGGRELAALGAQVVVPAGSGIEFPHRDLADGDAIEVGDARLAALAAPGHTYEHTVFLAHDERGVLGAAFTGGSMLVGSAGRTDLLGPEHTERLTRLQWESAQRLGRLLPADAEVLPTHGAGSFCSVSGNVRERRATFAEERERNPLLVSAGFETFRDLQLAGRSPTPRYYRYMAPINREGPRVYGSPPVPSRLDPAQLEEAEESGAQVVDVRSRHDYVRAHVPGSVAIGDGSSMLAFVGWLLPFNAPLVLVTDDAGQAGRLTVDLFRIGYERVRGYLSFDAWTAAGQHTDAIEHVDLDGAARIVRAGAHQVIDVRFAGESEQHPLPGALARPIEHLPEWLEGIERRPSLVLCETGYRAAMAASFLAARGVPVTVLVEGGATALHRRLSEVRVGS